MNMQRISHHAYLLTYHHGIGAGGNFSSGKHHRSLSFSQPDIRAIAGGNHCLYAKRRLFIPCGVGKSISVHGRLMKAGMIVLHPDRRSQHTSQRFLQRTGDLARGRHFA